MKAFAASVLGGLVISGSPRPKAAQVCIGVIENLALWHRRQPSDVFRKIRLPDPCTR